MQADDGQTGSIGAIFWTVGTGPDLQDRIADLEREVEVYLDGRARLPLESIVDVLRVRTQDPALSVAPERIGREFRRFDEELALARDVLRTDAELHLARTFQAAANLGRRGVIEACLLGRLNEIWRQARSDGLRHAAGFCRAHRVDPGLIC